MKSNYLLKHWWIVQYFLIFVCLGPCFLQNIEINTPPPKKKIAKRKPNKHVSYEIIFFSVDLSIRIVLLPFHSLCPCGTNMKLNACIDFAVHHYVENQRVLN